MAKSEGNEEGGRVLTFRIKPTGDAILAEYMRRKGLKQSDALRDMLRAGAIALMGETAVVGIAARLKREQSEEVT